MKIKKASPGLDQRNLLSKILGPDFQVEDFDGSRPLASQVADAGVLLIRDVPITADVIDAAPKLKLIQRPGDHLPTVDLERARARGIHVSRFPSKVQGTPARDVAEHALFLMLCLAKNMRKAEANLKRRIVGLPKTHRLAGKTVGLIGIGNTGSELARLAVAIGMRVIGVKRTLDEALRAELGLEFLGTYDDLAKVLRESDFVSLHLPMVRETVDFIGARELALMKPDAFLINIARAPMLNKNALLDALKSGRIAGVGLDVFWQEPPEPNDPLFALDNVIASPHIAGDTRENERRLAELTAENVRRVARGEPPRYEVGVDVDAGS